MLHVNNAGFKNLENKLLIIIIIYINIEFDTLVLTYYS